MTSLRFNLRAIAFLAILTAALADTSETIPAGQTVTLVASADGNPAPTFEWFRNGTKIGEGPQLVLPSITGNDSASYTVRASNSEGAATSPAYVLTVDDRTPPVIATAPQNTTIREGDPLTLSVVASGKPEPTFQWLKNGVPMAGATLAKLSWPAINRADAGTYTVVCTNEKGAVTSAPAVVNVLYGPSVPIIKSTFSVVELPKQSAVRWSVVATGESIRYSWAKNGAPIVGATGSTYSISKVNPSHAGVYSVTAANSAGSDTENIVRLIVY